VLSTVPTGVKKINSLFLIISSATTPWAVGTVEFPNGQRDYLCQDRGDSIDPPHHSHDKESA